MIAREELATALAAVGEPLMVPHAALLFECGEPCSGAYVITSGSVDVVLLSPTGMPVWSRTLNEGGILGLPASVAERSHHVRAIAAADAQLSFVPSERIRSMIQKDTHLGFLIVEAIGEEVNALRRKLSVPDCSTEA